MRVVMVGAGYVGLVSGACFSEFGIEVTCVDKDEGKISALRRGEIPIYEPGLDKLVEANAAVGRLVFTTDLKQTVRDADAVFISVGTPSRRGDGHADIDHVRAAVREVAAAIERYTVIITKSTVPVGTGRELAELVAETVSPELFDVVANPEFLREGSAIEDFMRPDRVIIGFGADAERAQEVMQTIYSPLSLHETPILFCDLETAELIKYATNAFLATKVTFINEMADLCEAVGADVHLVARGMGLDGRIGGKFLHAGPGYGGSCFPKDTLALARTAEDRGSPVRIVETVIDVNESRKKSMVGRIEAFCGSLDGQCIAILGLTFKPNTDDMRESPSLDIVPGLREAGAAVRVFDPAGMEAAREAFSDVVWCGDAYEAVEGADAVVLVTEWNAFRLLDLERIKQAMRASVMVDLRNVYDPEEMRRIGFRYASIGRPDTTPGD